MNKLKLKYFEWVIEDKQVSDLFSEWYKLLSKKHKLFLIVTYIMSFPFPFLKDRLNNKIENEFWNWYMIRRNK